MIPGLDGLRAIAFLLVFLCHTSYLQVGWVGVLLFFVLSGFLIGGILLKNKNSTNYFKTFYIRRTLRIFPLYYFLIFLYLVYPMPYSISRLHTNIVIVGTYYL